MTQIACLDSPANCATRVIMAQRHERNSYVVPAHRIDAAEDDIDHTGLTIVHDRTTRTFRQRRERCVVGCIPIFIRAGIRRSIHQMFRSKNPEKVVDFVSSVR